MESHLKHFHQSTFPYILLPFFPSMIFNQLTCVKQELQCMLNTRSLNSKNSAVIHILNIDMYTWMYMLKDAPVIVEAGGAITHAGAVHFEEFIQTSCREPQLSFWIGSSHHLAFAQGLFGLSFGIGVRFTLSCWLH
jgi:hypothetical protein